MLLNASDPVATRSAAAAPRVTLPALMAARHLGNAPFKMSFLERRLDTSESVGENRLLSQILRKSMWAPDLRVLP